jgi:hypothetical protein
MSLRFSLIVVLAMAPACAATTSHPYVPKQVRDAEAVACGDIPAEFREEIPYSHPGQVSEVLPLERRVPGTHVKRELRGAVIVVSDESGLSLASVNQTIRCHMAHVAAEGAQSPDSLDPFAIPDVEASVEKIPTGFAVSLDAGPERAHLVLSRSMPLDH